MNVWFILFSHIELQLSQVWLFSSKYYSWTLVANRVHVAVVVKTSQLPVLAVDPNVHTGAFLTGVYCHFDHPQQYKTIDAFTSQKNGWLILTCKCTCTYMCTTCTHVHVRSDSGQLLSALDIPWQVHVYHDISTFCTVIGGLSALLYLGKYIKSLH